jgi:hypothetical protein
MFFLASPNESIANQNNGGKTTVNKIIDQLVRQDVGNFINGFMSRNTVDKTDLRKKLDKAHETFTSKLIRVADTVIKENSSRFFDLLRITNEKQAQAQKLWGELCEEIADALFNRGLVPESYVNFVRIMMYHSVVSDEMEFFLSYYLKGPESVADILKHSNLIVNQPKAKVSQADNHQSIHSTVHNSNNSEIPSKKNDSEQITIQQPISQSRLQNAPDTPVDRKVIPLNGSRLANNSGLSQASKIDGHDIDYNYSDSGISHKQRTSSQSNNGVKSPQFSHFDNVDRNAGMHKNSHHYDNRDQQHTLPPTMKTHTQNDRTLTIKDINDLL